MYQIRINNMKFRGNIGVFAEEKTLGQNLAVDLEIEVRGQVVHDDLTETINYGLAYEKVAKIVTHSRVNLVETLATQIIQKVKQMDRDKITRVRVRIRKLAVPIDGIFDHVEIEMEG